MALELPAIMPPKAKRTGLCKDRGTQNSPVEIDNSETEAVSKLDEEGTAHGPKMGSSERRRASSTSSHQDELMADEEETRATAEALESLQWAEDPNKSPPGEDEYFQGSGI